MIANYTLMFACGALTKFTDNLVDKPFKSKKWVKAISGLAYGATAGYLATTSTEFATLILAITIGVLLAGKIDSLEHQAAMAAMLSFILLLGLPEISLAAMAIFVALGFLDETMNDLMDKTGKKMPKAVKKVFNARLFLEAGTIAIGIATGNFVYFTALLSFDLAYNITDKAMPFLFKKKA